jgi:restriction system protein
MPVPTYQEFMRPLLVAAAEAGSDISIHEIADSIAGQFGLSDADISEEIPSGGQTVFYNRLHWARTYLGKAGFLVSPKRGRFTITDKGRAALARHQGEITNDVLAESPEFREWRAKSASTKRNQTSKEDPIPASGESISNDTPEIKELSPDDLIDSGYAKIKYELESDILERLKKVHPKQFEHVVVELLQKMGFGGRVSGRARVTRYSGDEGIDGIIDEDALGLDAVYVQEKRYFDNTVGQPAVQQFVGSMDGRGAHKGVFVTTSTFSRSAHDYAVRTSKRIALIDGPRLATLCVEHGVGVRPRRTITLWKVDDSYFEGES